MLYPAAGPRNCETIASQHDNKIRVENRYGNLIFANNPIIKCGVAKYSIRQMLH